LNTNFLKEVLNHAEAACGKKYQNKLLVLREERERFLNNHWQRKKAPRELKKKQRDDILRNIDFDTIVYYAGKYIKGKEYTNLLIKIALTAINYGELNSAKYILESLLGKYLGFLDDAFMARTLLLLGQIHFYQNNYDSAIKSCNESLRLYNKLKDDNGIAQIKNNMGILMVEKGYLNEGEKLFKDSLDIARENNLFDLIAKTNMHLGNLYHQYGDFNEAIISYNNSLKCTEAEVTPETKTLIYLNLAITYKSQQEYNKAFDVLQKSLKIIQVTKNKYHKGLAYIVKSELSLSNKDYASSIAFITTSFSIFSEIGDRLSVAETYKILGIINRETGKYDQSLSYFENSIRINKEMNHKLNLAEGNIELAKLYIVKKNIQEALKCLAQSEALFKDQNADLRVKMVKELKETIQE